MIELKPSIKKKRVGKIGLLKQKDGSLIYDDSWMHTDLEEEYGILEKSTRTLNRGKLIQRRVMVKRTDGSTFYRMQWVDPSKDMINQDTEGQEIEENKGIRGVANKKEENFYINLNEDELRQEQPVLDDKLLEADTNWKDLMASINEKLRGMSIDDKIELMEKCGIKDIDYANRIGWMKKVQELKLYLKDKPHLIDLDNISKQGTTPDGTESIQDILNNSTDESIYALMKKLGIADEDPRSNPNYSEKSAGIRHFNNMMKLKIQIKGDKSLLDQLSSKNTVGNSKDKNVIQNNGHNITTILNSMSREDKYRMMKLLKINDGTDPMYNPAFLANNMHAKMHMQYMAKLKRQIELNPSILSNLDNKIKQEPENTGEDRLTSIRNKLKECTKETKETLLYQYRKHPMLVNMEKSKNPSVNWMRSMMALTEILAEDTNYEDFEKKYNTDKLYNHKFINKDIEKFLRGIVGIKGEKAEVIQVEKGMEWEFYNSSYVRKNYDDNDVPVLTVVTFNDDGEIESEVDYKIEDVVNFLEDKKSKKKQQEKTAVESLYDNTPLHELPYQDMMKRIKKEGVSIIDDKTFNVISDKATEYWNNISDDDKLKGSWNIISDILPGLNKKQMMGFLRHYGVTCNENGFSSTSKDWFKIVYKDKFQNTRKLMHSSNYLIKIGEKTYTDALHESAKNWSTSEINESIEEFTENMITFSDKDLPLPDYIDSFDMESNKEKATQYVADIFKTLPYDLFTDVITSSALSNGIKFDRAEGMRSIGAYSADTSTIYMSRAYIDTLHMGDKGIDSNGIGFDWTRHDKETNTAPLLQSLSRVIIHEFGHAIDHYLTGGTGKTDSSIARWSSGKYVSPDNKSCVARSFNSMVAKSNKKRKLGFIPTGVDSSGKEVGYYYMKDNWLSAYEGRLYSINENSLAKNKDGTYSTTDSTKYNTGQEHWAENFERVMNSVLHYKKENDTFDAKSYKDFVTEQYNKAIEGGLNLETTSVDKLKDFHVRAGAVLNVNPMMFDTIESMFIRGNFKEE